MISDQMDWWDDYPRRSIDKESTIRAIAAWINAEGTVMPHTVLHLYYGGFRVGVVCPADPGMLHVPVEHAFASSAMALAELGLLIDTAVRRMESNTWPEGPALDEIVQDQKIRQADKLNTLATLLLEREPHLIDEIHEGTKPGRLFLDAASLPSCLWDAFDVEGEAFKHALEEEIHRRVTSQ